MLGVGFGLAVIIGNTIGAGIFRAPGVIAQQVPNPWLFMGVWVGGGLYALLGAMALAELGTMIPRSGGQYVFARYALGEYAGFIVGWSDWISTCGSTAAVSIVIGEFAGALFPALSGALQLGPFAIKKAVVIAGSVAIVFAVLQWRGIVMGSQVQNLTSLLKALAFVVLIAAAFLLGGKPVVVTPPLAAVAPAVPLAMLLALMLALQSVIYTYDGWSGVIYFSEEVKNPGRSVPRALFGGVLLIIGIYLLVNLALLYVLPMSQIAGQDFAAGVAAQAIFGKFGETIFLSLTILSMLSGINAYHFIVFGKTFEKVITVLAFFFVANYALSFLSVFVLRRREPQKERPYRAWGYPWTTALALLGSVAFLLGAVASDLGSGSRDSIYAVLLLAASYPVFRVIKLMKSAEKIPWQE